MAVFTAQAKNKLNKSLIYEHNRKALWLSIPFILENLFADTSLMWVLQKTGSLLQSTVTQDQPLK